MRLIKFMKYLNILLICMIINNCGFKGDLFLPKQPELKSHKIESGSLYSEHN